MCVRTADSDSWTFLWKLVKVYRNQWNPDRNLYQTMWIYTENYCNWNKFFFLSYLFIFSKFDEISDRKSLFFYGHEHKCSSITNMMHHCLSYLYLRKLASDTIFFINGYESSSGFDIYLTWWFICEIDD